MSIRRRAGLLAVALTVSLVFTASANNRTVSSTSPDGTLEVVVHVDDGALGWSLSREGDTIVEPSRLGFSLSPAADIGMADDWTIEGESSEHDGTWEPVYGERGSIRDHYTQLVVHLQEREKQKRKLALTFRIYDTGVAFAYTFPEQPNLKQFVIDEELTQFILPDPEAPAWAAYSAQGEYKRVPLKRVRKECERPLVVELAEDCYVAIGEARLVDFARMRLQPVKDMAGHLQAQLASKVNVTTPYTTPWRYVMVGETPGELVENNDFILNLNDPCAIEDTSWIKPGKIIREVTLTTAGGKACVDFAVEQNIPYIHLDAGWYGHEYDENQDATTVTPDPKRVGPNPDLDLPEVLRYAEEHGIGVWVYVNRRHLEKQLDEILPLYKSWGIKGVKYGFVQVGSQKWTTWLHEAVRKAAEHELMVDIHDEYRPTGYSRTYPNLLTQEGIRGNEEMPPPEQNLVTAFARMICGAGDYTICWYTDRIKTTHAHQLAASVGFYSPLLYVYWYDQPKQYQGEPETAFLKHIPTVWDDTKVLDGAIGEYIVIARRSGEEWYLVVMNAVEKRTLSIPLDFLDEGVAYTATIHADANPDGGDPFAVTMSTGIVSSTTTLEPVMAANGGYAVRLVPTSN